MQKKKGFILYFDILGYRNILKNNTDSENERIANILEQFSSFYSKSNVVLGFGSNFDKEKLFMRAFSDNFLFVYELDENDYQGLITLQLVATQIQNQFLNVGLLTRGSITYGEILYNDHIVFGVDLIDAVELEENHRMPSIIVDSKLKYLFENNGLQYQEEIPMFDIWPDSKTDYEECIKGIEIYLDSLNKTYVDNKVLEKIKWVIEKLNEYFSEHQGVKYKLVQSYNYHLEKKSE